MTPWTVTVVVPAEFPLGGANDERWVNPFCASETDPCT
jgi:hypothetical protein